MRLLSLEGVRGEIVMKLSHNGGNFQGEGGWGGGVT